VFVAILGAVLILFKQFSAKNTRSELFLMVVWGAFIISATFTQRRFGVYLVFPVSALTAYTVSRVISWTDFSFDDGVETYEVITIGALVLTVVGTLLLVAPTALAFESEMDDDLNTARAKQVLMEAVNRINSAMEKGEDMDESVADRLSELFGILGVSVENKSDRESDMADLLLELREGAREREDYETSDRIRDRMEELGFEVEDTEEGARWF
jgi:hypothetical protein